MDYCSSCRRHLNGALVCPGCGAYAPDIAPTNADGRTVPGPATVGATAAWAPGPDAWPGGGLHRGTLHDEADGGLYGAGTDEAPPAEPSGDLGGAPPVPEGRAARRRQRARWKKNQRRAVVATAVALVGGGLTLGTMDRHSTNRAEAATAPEITGPGTEDEQTTQDSLPTSTRPDAHRSSPTPSEPALPRQRSAAPPRNMPSNVQPDSADQPRTAAKPTPQPQAGSRSSGGSVSNSSSSNSSSSDGSGSAGSGSAGSNSGGSADDSGTAATPTPTPTGGADGSSDTGGDSGTGSGTSQANSGPTATSPAGEICVLVLCLG
ncbi:hypothetical protein ACFYWX_43415 [Streptomyces sp. NPDC002888]|uniref:SCO2400 family protein n=1 Tax=Streptomyces sp. NPDC002888 TaxID=3364668 RepID=UPI0036A31503